MYIYVIFIYYILMNCVSVNLFFYFQGKEYGMKNYHHLFIY